MYKSKLNHSIYIYCKPLQLGWVITRENIRQMFFTKYDVSNLNSGCCNRSVRNQSLSRHKVTPSYEPYARNVTCLCITNATGSETLSMIVKRVTVLEDKVKTRGYIPWKTRQTDRCQQIFLHKFTLQNSRFFIMCLF